jgi:hypothetical protein
MQGRRNVGRIVFTVAFRTMVAVAAAFLASTLAAGFLVAAETSINNASSAKPSSSHRVLVDGKLPEDSRLGPLTTLNGYFPFTPPKSKEQWDERAELVRRQILVANGLWPLPEKTPLNAVVHGKVDREKNSGRALPVRPLRRRAVF